MWQLTEQLQANGKASWNIKKRKTNNRIKAL